jgi:hypothetical protein
MRNEYLSGTVRLDRVPPGRVLVHNHAKHGRQTRSGTHGFRAWLADPAPYYVPCDCGWLRRLGVHYRVDRDGAAAIEAIVVDTREYMFAHGKRPQGFKSWQFHFDRAVASAFWHAGTYRKAKQAALAEARRIGATVVRVVP